MPSRPTELLSATPRSALPPGALWGRLLVGAAWLAAAASAGAQQGDSTAAADPRVGLRGAHTVDAEEAISNLTLIAHRPRPQWPVGSGALAYSEALKGATGPQADAVRQVLGDLTYANSDLAFRGNVVFQGSFNGFSVWDISDVSNPKLRSTFVCPGGQGDPSVYGNLLFMSVEEVRGRVDCGTQGVAEASSPERFRGVRIFDITDIDHPKQVAAVQTCRGSHTHTLIPDPKNSRVLYVYVSGTAGVRPASELAGCVQAAPDSNNRVDPNTSLFRIEIIRVPLDAPQDAKVIGAPRIFADAKTGAVNGLWKGGGHGQGTQETAVTNMCHDVTVYPAYGLAAGACSGNGILLDIHDPTNPKRIGEITDPNFAYFHSATFNNDASTVIFTDEWGGGLAPRCRTTDPKNWGADAIFKRTGGTLQLAAYYKLPAPQSDKENCVAHNGSLIPVPGRDIVAQAWYQGGLSVFDFTDPAHPKEIAYFDRGPIDESRVVLGGYWSTYWYNGHIFGTEIIRGLDIFALKPSAYLSQNEIDAADLVQWPQANPSDQQKIVWPASFVVARAYIDQLTRDHGLSTQSLSQISGELDQAEHQSGGERSATLKKLAQHVAGEAKGSSDAPRVHLLEGEIKELVVAKPGA
jgi:hypothetical protein